MCECACSCCVCSRLCSKSSQRWPPCSPPALPRASGPAIKAGEGLFPGPTTPVAGLYCCGDSRFPGIGLPAVAASGAICANTLVPVWDHLRLLEELAV